MAEAKKNTNTEEMVTIKLLRDNKKGDLFVSVNERTWLIQRGVSVEVPACVASVIANAEEMENEAYEYNESVKH